MPNVSIEQYRISIGTFNSSHKSTKNCDSSKNCKALWTSISTKCMIFLIMLIVMAGGALASRNLVRQISNHEMKIYNGNRVKSIKLAHWNKGNSLLVSRMHEIKNLVECHSPQVIGISEANFSKDHNKNLVEIPDYELYLCPVAGIEMHRIAVYCHKDLIVKPRPDLSSQNFSSIWLECNLPRQKKFLICNAYREWQVPDVDGSLTVAEQLLRWQTFLLQWEKAAASGLEVLVMGDMNINHLNWQYQGQNASKQTNKLRPLINELFAKIIPYGFAQLVKVATRHFPGQVSTGLDHVYSNVPDKIQEVRALHWGGSDHMLILTVRRSRSYYSSPTYIRKRSYKRFDQDQFLSLVRTTNWLPIYLCEDVDHAVTQFTQKMTAILDILCPMRTIQLRKNYAPWLSDNMKKLIKWRDGLHKKAVESQDKNDWGHYKKVRNMITNNLRFEERTWQRKNIQIHEGNSNSSGTWKTIKRILNWKSSGSPTRLYYNGILKTKSQEVADIQNDFFIRKIENIKKSMKSSNSDPLCLLRKLMKNRQCNFRLKPVYPDTVQKIIAGLSNSKSFGFDNIDTQCLKLAKDEIVPVITHIINLSISQNRFPESWKQSKIIPLHKKDDPLNPKNYRPVAILPILSKVLEKAIYIQVKDYLD